MYLLAWLWCAEKNFLNLELSLFEITTTLLWQAAIWGTFPKYVFFFFLHFTPSTVISKVPLSDLTIYKFIDHGMWSDRWCGKHHAQLPLLSLTYVKYPSDLGGLRYIKNYYGPFYAQLRLLSSIGCQVPIIAPSCALSSDHVFDRPLHLCVLSLCLKKGKIMNLRTNLYIHDFRILEISNAS